MATAQLVDALTALVFDPEKVATALRALLQVKLPLGAVFAPRVLARTLAEFLVGVVTALGTHRHLVLTPTVAHWPVAAGSGSSLGLLQFPRRTLGDAADRAADADPEAVFLGVDRVPVVSAAMALAAVRALDAGEAVLTEFVGAVRGAWDATPSRDCPVWRRVASAFGSLVSHAESWHVMATLATGLVPGAIHPQWVAARTSLLRTFCETPVVEPMTHVQQAWATACLPVTVRDVDDDNDDDPEPPPDEAVVSRVHTTALVRQYLGALKALTCRRRALPSDAWLESLKTLGSVPTLVLHHRRGAATVSAQAALTVARVLAAGPGGEGATSLTATLGATRAAVLRGLHAVSSAVAVTTAPEAVQVAAGLRPATSALQAPVSDAFSVVATTLPRTRGADLGAVAEDVARADCLVALYRALPFTVAAALAAAVAPGLPAAPGLHLPLLWAHIAYVQEALTVASACATAMEGMVAHYTTALARLNNVPQGQRPDRDSVTRLVTQRKRVADTLNTVHPVLLGRLSPGLRAFTLAFDALVVAYAAAGPVVLRPFGALVHGLAPSNVAAAVGSALCCARMMGWTGPGDPDGFPDVADPAVAPWRDTTTDACVAPGTPPAAATLVVTTIWQLAAAVAATLVEAVAGPAPAATEAREVRSRTVVPPRIQTLVGDLACDLRLSGVVFLAFQLTPDVERAAVFATRNLFTSATGSRFVSMCNFHVGDALRPGTPTTLTLRRIAVAEHLLAESAACRAGMPFLAGCIHPVMVTTSPAQDQLPMVVAALELAWVRDAGARVFLTRDARVEVAWSGSAAAAVFVSGLALQMAALGFAEVHHLSAQAQAAAGAPTPGELIEGAPAALPLFPVVVFCGAVAMRVVAPGPEAEVGPVPWGRGGAAGFVVHVWAWVSRVCQTRAAYVHKGVNRCRNNPAAAARGVRVLITLLALVRWSGGWRRLWALAGSGHTEFSVTHAGLLRVVARFAATGLGSGADTFSSAMNTIESTFQADPTLSLSAFAIAGAPLPAAVRSPSGRPMTGWEWAPRAVTAWDAVGNKRPPAVWAVSTVWAFLDRAACVRRDPRRGHQPDLRVPAPAVFQTWGGRPVAKDHTTGAPAKKPRHDPEGATDTPSAVFAAVLSPLQRQDSDAVWRLEDGDADTTAAAAAATQELLEVTRGLQAVQFVDKGPHGWDPQLPVQAAEVWPVAAAAAATGGYAVSAVETLDGVAGTMDCVPHTALPYVAANVTTPRRDTGMCAPCTAGSPDFLASVVDSMGVFAQGVRGLVIANGAVVPTTAPSV
jgi:hypothetical protein